MRAAGLIHQLARRAKMVSRLPLNDGHYADTPRTLQIAPLFDSERYDFPLFAAISFDFYASHRVGCHLTAAVLGRL